MLGGVTVRGADKALTACTECSSRNYGYLFRVEQLFAEFVTGKSRGADTGKGVERALRLAARKTDPIEARNDQAAAHIVFLSHRKNGFVTVAERLDRGVLRRCGGNISKRQALRQLKCK